ncbi:hypothetical protein QEJ31_15020 [Pigmentibacter sp. JX0631]|uniref:hypothetical protein n=1 Tax=Pigmentibacter sp. JX0631 TaxID=2976982 RepID=UPI0024690C53|nr:hypothetical protein [Pigmentibacter sp. JX0631]WGL59841.1 hypothetical protein QEJ31_15020 [Pigmentibacter sp. JX0631]
MKISKKSLVCFLVSIYQFQAHSLEGLIVEANPLLLIKQGFGLNTEVGLSQNISSGIGLEGYQQKLYANNTLNAKRDIYNLSYFMRYYLFAEKLLGPFIQGKINYTHSEINLADYQDSYNSKKDYFSFVFSVGYRFVSENGFTLSGYIGGGIKSGTNYIDKNNLPNNKSSNSDWIKATDELNKQENNFQPDLGITAGYYF